MKCNDIGSFLAEDEWPNFFYQHSLPRQTVHCRLQFKSPLTIAGLPYFIAVFRHLDPDVSLQLEGEGQVTSGPLELQFDLPFAVALTGERVALNLLQRACSVASYTNRCVAKARPWDIDILDTRKTTPGLRQLEKYAVRVGGGKNHRMGQTDVWMIKDNHKSFFGGLARAWKFFNSLGAYYQPIVVEVHNLAELQDALELGVRHIMLDNFSPELIERAVKLKGKGVSYEVSGGVSLENMDCFLIEGVDAISMGALTQGCWPVDLSLKY